LAVHNRRITAKISLRKHPGFTKVQSIACRTALRGDSSKGLLKSARHLFFAHRQPIDEHESKTILLATSPAFQVNFFTRASPAVISNR
jgi:hypothetical protein